MVFLQSDFIVAYGFGLGIFMYGVYSFSDPGFAIENILIVGGFGATLGYMIKDRFPCCNGCAQTNSRCQ